MREPQARLAESAPMARVFGMVTTSASHFYTHHALATFLRRTPLRGDDLLVLIDNDGDYSPTIRHARLTVVRNPCPRGFARNVNTVLALARRRAADLVFLNNDLVFTEQWLEPLCRRDDAILISASNQFFQYRSLDGRLELGGALDWAQFDGLEARLDEIVARHKRRFAGGQTMRSRLMPFYCFRLPALVYGAVGDFDESFGSGGAEDVDYRIRALLAGFDVEIVLDSYVLHFQGKSTWRSGEGPEATAHRDDAYREAFRRKWGDDLAAILLAGNEAMPRLTQLGLGPAHERRDYRMIIAQCVLRSPPRRA